MRTHPLYGRPHAIVSVHDLTPRTFEECLSSLTMAIGQLERLTLSPEQRDRVRLSATRLAATTEKQQCPDLPKSR